MSTYTKVPRGEIFLKLTSGLSQGSGEFEPVFSHGTMGWSTGQPSVLDRTCAVQFAMVFALPCYNLREDFFLTTDLFLNDTYHVSSESAAPAPSSVSGKSTWSPNPEQIPLQWTR